MRETTFIYGLICPETNQLMYIGKANDPNRRLRDHVSDYRGAEINRITWIRKLRRKKLKPVIEIIDEVGMDCWQYWEMFWIAYYRYIGAALLNVEKGGNGLSEACETSFKKGNKFGKL